MLELLSPAGSPEAVIATVQSGADAIYMPSHGFTVRGIPKKLSDSDFESALQYCRARGCKVYLALNRFTSDDELPEALRLARRASELGADAIMVQDIGLVRVLRQAVPDIPIHADFRMGVHNLAGVEAAAELGVSRVTLARELSREEINYIASRSTVELAVSVHGPLCFCHSGQCYMSAFTTGRSVNLGMCSYPCRIRYNLGGRMDEYPLSLKEHYLLEHVEELSRAGIACVRIDGMDMRPEHCAVLTRTYSRAIRDKILPTGAELERLELVLSQEELTDGYFIGSRDQDMFGVQGEPDRDAEMVYAEVRKSYLSTELRRIPVTFFVLIQPGQPVRMAAEDADGNRAVVSGPAPEASDDVQAITAEILEEQLYKTGGTPFICSDIKSQVAPGLFVPPALLGDLRGELLSQLTAKRKELPRRRLGSPPPSPASKPQPSSPVLNFQVQSPDQLTEELAALRPDCIYVPLAVLAEEFEKVMPFMEAGAKPVAVLPRIITEKDGAKVKNLLRKVHNLGVTEALVNNMGHIRLARLSGFRLRGDFGLNIFNSYSLKALDDADFLSAALSFELRLSQIRDMAKPLDTEILAYGRPPVMVTDHCIIKNSFGRCACQNVQYLSDRRGSVFPVVQEFDCRNVVYHSHKLFLADRRQDLENSGLWALRLLFTTESSRECVEVAKSYMGLSNYRPNGLTRGLYYKGAKGVE
jgi:putative protease